MFSKKSQNKAQNGIILKENDWVITDTSELCEIFAHFFSTVSNSIGQPDYIEMTHKDILSKVLERCANHPSVKTIKERHMDNNKFDFKPVDEIYVRKLLNNINAQKSTGYESIPPKMVKMCADELSVTLSELINYTFSKKILFPDDMKKAEISPTFEKNDDLNKDNYRPIRILVVFSKIFETIIPEQLMEYFSSIFNNMLCAYHKKYDTEHVLIKLRDS